MAKLSNAVQAFRARSCPSHFFGPSLLSPWEGEEERQPQAEQQRGKHVAATGLSMFPPPSQFLYNTPRRRRRWLDAVSRDASLRAERVMSQRAPLEDSRRG